jgi:flagellar basal-body rod modification protein FlgD
MDIQMDMQMSSVEFTRAKAQVSETNRSIGVNFEGEKTNLGKDAFLRLLITQLQHQDPTRPMEDREFIAQMAQFSSLEQMTNLNREVGSLLASYDAVKASSFLGKDVDMISPLTGELVRGEVQSVMFAENQIFLRVNNRDVPLENVRAIHQPEKISENINLTKAEE